MTNRPRASQSKRKHNRELRQHLNDPSLRVKRGGPPLAPEIEAPADGDWSKEIVQAERELRKAYADLT